MNSYQSSAVTTSHLNSFGDDHAQNYQDQNTMSWPTSSSSPTTVLSFDVGNLEPSPIQSTPQQSSAKCEDKLSSANFQCEYCSQVFSKQYELTLVSFCNLRETEHSLQITGSMNGSIRNLYSAISAPRGM
jgi:hypothetical protein